MDASKTTQIAGVDYHTVLFPADDAVGLALRLFDLFSEPLGPILDGMLEGGLKGGIEELLEGKISLEKALPALSARLIQNRDLVAALLKHTSRDGVRLDSKESFNAAYTGNLAECAAALRWVFEVNDFVGFFRGFTGL